MRPAAGVYRGIIVRAVTGIHPAIIATVDDASRLELLCEQLVRAERIADMLQSKGLDLLPIDEGVRLLVEKE
jgi:hypothetical protein